MMRKHFISWFLILGVASGLAATARAARIVVDPCYGESTQTKPIQADDQKVAVLELRNDAGLAGSEVAYLTDRLRDVATSALPVRQFRTLTRENTKDFIPPDVTEEECISGDSFLEIGRFLDADYIVTGEVLRFGDGYRLKLKAHHCSSSVHIGGTTAAGETLEQLEHHIEGPAERVLSLVDAHGRGESLSPGDDTGPPRSRGGGTTSTVVRPNGKGSSEVNDSVRMILIPPGELIQGSYSHNDPERNVDEIPHRIRFTESFYLSATEISQSQWAAIMNSNPSSFVGENLPVENVTWIDAIRFCNALSEVEGFSPAYEITDGQVRWNRTSNGYRLPTESEWEYACRAGTRTSFNRGPCLTAKQANFNGGFPPMGCSVGVVRGAPVEVGSFEPNSWGVFDMHGNVCEWCWDLYSSYLQRDVGGEEAAAVSPVAADADCDRGLRRVVRGGGYQSWGKECRSASRRQVNRNHAYPDVGFRVARSAN